MTLFAMHWRRAITTSFLIHLALILILGHLMTGVFTAPPVIEQILELDLTSEVIQSAASLPAPASQLHSSEPVIQTVPAESQIVAAAEDMDVVTADIPVLTSGKTATSQPAASIGNSLAAAAADSSTKGGSISPPRVLSMVDPYYPEAARQAGFEGTTVLKIQILEDGRPGSVVLSRSSGREALDDAAIAAVHQWSFVPARDRDSGHNIVCYIIKPFTFRLTK